MVNELRAPLTALLGYVEALQDDVLVAGPPVYARMLTEARRLKLLIEALEERLRG
jgi:signal transduction histidine kinase